MNTYKGYSKIWFLALLLVTFVAGCAGNDTVAPIAEVPNSAVKAITAFSISGATGTIDETATPKTIAVTMPTGTDLKALAATFTTTGASVTVGTPAVVQKSGTTTNDFTGPVVYDVAAADGSKTTYTVTVTVASFTAKAITAYSFVGPKGTIASGIITESTTPKTIAVSVPNGTNVTALVATFTTTGSGVKVGTVIQTSSTNANDFTTSPVAYIVTAGDGTTETYNVTVTTAKGPAPVSLGMAGNFVILAETKISTTGVTAITGDIALSPNAATFITGFGLIADSSNVFSTSSLITGKVYAANYAVPTPSNLTAAVNDMLTAYNDAAGRPIPDFTELGAGDISGKTLVPGLYKWGTNVLINTDVTLNGGPNDVWIFQIAQDLTLANGIKIILAGGALPKNIFWQVGGGTGVALGTTSHFEGIILATKAITVNTGATINGRLLAQSAVTLDANTVKVP